ncbi:MAG TPA: hypothetical protein VGM75_16240, partial [Pseudonocardiaceae bacterium]
STVRPRAGRFSPTAPTIHRLDVQGLQRTDAGTDQVPWDPGSQPYFASIADPNLISLTNPDNGNLLGVARKDVIDMIASDPALTGRAAGAPIVLVMPTIATTDLTFVRALAKATGRTVWASTGHVTLPHGDNADGGLELWLQPDKSLGYWVKAVSPGEAGHVPVSYPNDPADRIPNVDSEQFPAADVRTFPIAGPAGMVSGHFTMTYQEAALNEATVGHFTPDTEDFLHIPGNGTAIPNGDDARWENVPWQGRPIYVALAHGTPGHIALQTPTGMQIIDPPAYARWLARRPSVLALPEDAVIVVAACNAGSSGPSGQSVVEAVAQETGRRAIGPNSKIKIVPATLDDGTAFSAFALEEPVPGESGEWITGRPQSPQSPRSELTTIRFTEGSTMLSPDEVTMLVRLARKALRWITDQQSVGLRPRIVVTGYGGDDAESRAQATAQAFATILEAELPGWLDRDPSRQATPPDLTTVSIEVRVGDDTNPPRYGRTPRIQVNAATVELREVVLAPTGDSSRLSSGEIVPSSPPTVVYLDIPSVGPSSATSVRKWLQGQGDTVMASADKPTPKAGRILVEIAGNLIDSPSPSDGGWPVSTAKLLRLDAVVPQTGGGTPQRSNLGAVSRSSADLGPRDVSSNVDIVRFGSPTKSSGQSALGDGVLAPASPGTHGGMRAGLVFAGRMSPADRAQAVFGLPKWAGVQTVAGVYSSATDTLKSVAGEYTAADFAKRFGGRPGIVALVASGTAADRPEGSSYAARVAEALNQPALAPVGHAVQLPGGRVVAGGITGIGTKSPALSMTHTNGWRMFRPDGTSEYLNGFDFNNAVEQALAKTGVQPAAIAATKSNAAGLTEPVVWSAEEKGEGVSTARSALATGPELSFSLASLTNHNSPSAMTSTVSTLLTAEPVPGRGVTLDSGGVYFASGVDQEDLVAGMAVQAWEADFGDQFEPVYVHADRAADGVQTATGFMTNAQFAKWFKQTRTSSAKPILLVMCGGAHVKNAENKSMGEMLATETGRDVLTVGGILWQTEEGVQPVPFDAELLQEAASHRPPTGPVPANLDQRWGWQYFSPRSTTPEGNLTPRPLGHDLRKAITQLGLTSPSSVASPTLVESVAWVSTRSAGPIRRANC